MTEPVDSQELDKAKTRCTDIAFGCSACHSLLGFVDKDTKSKIRIKYRDLYIRITDAELIEMTCRSCGEINKLAGGI